MAKKKEYIIHEPTTEEAHMNTQKQLTNIENRVEVCDQNVIGEIQSTQSNLSFYLYHKLLTQHEYFEYLSQLDVSVSRFKKQCVCTKK